MTSAIDSRNDSRKLYNKYVTLFRHIDVLESDLPPPRLNRSRPSLYPALPCADPSEYDLINKYCHLICLRHVERPL
ncbi:ORF68 [Plodia interpunctella granulovirus]|uniref:ORF68 n=1 Tax=Plodia interpunctella granulovirus TaxID=262175 RepID=A0A1L5JGN6_9BBAC|nr:ORF68 [Plodia interpunctella granulovirus]APO13952.1 ORF68 [Plodia interpunctella granulovirus]